MIRRKIYFFTIFCIARDLRYICRRILIINPMDFLI